MKLLETSASELERLERKKKRKNPDGGFAGEKRRPSRSYSRATIVLLFLLKSLLSCLPFLLPLFSLQTMSRPSSGSTSGSPDRWNPTWKHTRNKSRKCEGNLVVNTCTLGCVVT